MQFKSLTRRAFPCHVIHIFAHTLLSANRTCQQARNSLPEPAGGAAPRPHTVRSPSSQAGTRWRRWAARPDTSSRSRWVRPRGTGCWNPRDGRAGTAFSGRGVCLGSAPAYRGSGCGERLLLTSHYQPEDLFTPGDPSLRPAGNFRETPGGGAVGAGFRD